MCFVLYAATTRPLPAQAWKENSPDLYVQPLTSRDAGVKAHFHNPEVRSVGSTSGCGCNFPHALFQDGAWSYFSEKQTEPDEAVKHQANRESLYKLLRATGERLVELYGVWEGDFNEPPLASETVLLEDILSPDFRFKERGFYRVRISELN